MAEHDEVQEYLRKRFGHMPVRQVPGHWTLCECRTCMALKMNRHEHLEMAVIWLRSELGIRIPKRWAKVPLDDIEFELEAAAELVMARERAGQVAA